MTSIAAISSRMVREPRSAVIADPTAAAIIIAPTSEAAWRMTASPLAAPANDVAPTWPAQRELHRQGDADRQRHQHGGHQQRCPP